MTKVQKHSRIIVKNTITPGAVGTVAPSDDHTILPAWSTTDMYKGEFFINLQDERLWIRTNFGVREIPMLSLSALTLSRLSDMSDVYLSSLTTNEVLKYSGGTWLNAPDDSVTEVIWDKYDQTLTLQTQSGDRFIEIEGRPIDLITGNTLLDKGYYTVICYSGITITLPTASGYTDDTYYGTIFKIKIISDGECYIDCEGVSDLIFDDAYTSPPYTHTTKGKTITLQSDGRYTWYII